MLVITAVALMSRANDTFLSFSSLRSSAMNRKLACVCSTFTTANDRCLSFEKQVPAVLDKVLAWPRVSTFDANLP